ncbi:FAD/NAD(P)-binding protein [Chitinophaga horti]|uniref:FAD/NAD(P)-binding protein n=1 Tax=Chitinophaga horti TaxID=2920382 RepID=A0ABY6J9L9_9BACT|nr:FAD/NAD(P)-binding protein [Chitinophaga horti]UYQ94991.1 FAD/NAD(P)-binding protein [Chitinophaga horti]
MYKDHTPNLAIIGGGPGGLFMFKRLLEQDEKNWTITIFEKNDCLGAGMPYSKDGACLEHVTNVSGNEIPEIVVGLADWVKTQPAAFLKSYGIDADKFHEYKVVPRLLFGAYLSDQFKRLKQRAVDAGIKVTCHFGTEVTDIIDEPEGRTVTVCTADKSYTFDSVIIATGHFWPRIHENEVKGYFDSPYPPSKLDFTVNGPVAIKGASLTAIDAIRTLARNHGHFQSNDDGRLQYTLKTDHPDFNIVMHSRNGLLPAVRFHLEDSTMGRSTVLTRDEVVANQEENGGFLSLDYVFEKTFKAPLRERHPAFYQEIHDMGIEAFVDRMMTMRENIPPFDLFKAEYVEAEKSIRRQQPVHWKEMLAVLSFTMNFPAKYFSAEDMLRLQKTLMPLISLVIAFVPQSSAAEMIALYEAGILQLQSVGDNSHVEPQQEGGVIYSIWDDAGEERNTSYPYFIDCTGQPHLKFEDFPFKGLHSGSISPAKVKFADQAKGEAAYKDGDPRVSKDAAGNYYLSVGGIAINDHFQIVDQYNAYNERIYVMAVPFMSGFNPDYSGLDFCEAASAAIATALCISATK